MTRPTTLQVLTANRLADGAVVFLDRQGGWADGLDQANAVAAASDVARLEEAGAEAAAANIVVEPYLVAVEPTAGALVPHALRERRRAQGPSIAFGA